jgi:choline transport protein
MDIALVGIPRKSQKNLHKASAIAFTVILQGTWEVLLVASTEGLVNGGTAGLIWTYILNFFGMAFVVLSVAEMAAIAPASGGQYHWVSVFAPPKYKRVLSFFVGWLSATAWQAGAATGPFLVGTLAGSILQMNDIGHGKTSAQDTWLVWLIAVVVYASNRSCGVAWPRAVLSLHILGLISVSTIDGSHIVSGAKGLTWFTGCRFAFGTGRTQFRIRSVY